MSAQAAAPKVPSTGTIKPFVPWALAGLAVIAVATVFVNFRGGETDSRTTVAPAVAGAMDPSAIDISSMTPRERADRLFNRIMQSASAGDTAQARAFIPMALAAYDQVPDLDLDGRYHLSILHLVNDDPASARAEADAILDQEPNHLFGLFTAAQAEDYQGNASGAEELYRRFLDAYDQEISRRLTEYLDHAQVLPINREEARERLGR